MSENLRILFNGRVALVIGGRLQNKFWKWFEEKLVRNSITNLNIRNERNHSPFLKNWDENAICSLTRTSDGHWLFCLKNIGLYIYRIGKVLRRNQTLKKLTISMNNVRSIDARQLAEGLKHNRTLSHFEIYGEFTYIEPGSAAAFSKALRTNRTLTTFNVYNLLLHKEESFAHMLKENWALLSVHGVKYCTSSLKRNQRGRDNARRAVLGLIVIRRQLQPGELQPTLQPTLQSTLQLGELLHFIPKEIVQTIAQEMWRLRKVWVFQKKY